MGFRGLPGVGTGNLLHLVIIEMEVELRTLMPSFDIDDLSILCLRRSMHVVKYLQYLL
jgi:hypothetical protein